MCVCVCVCVCVCGVCSSIVYTHELCRRQRLISMFVCFFFPFEN